MGHTFRNYDNFCCHTNLYNDMILGSSDSASSVLWIIFEELNFCGLTHEKHERLQS